MNRILAFFLVAVFSIFVGSQITEGCLLLPYWKTLAPVAFYEYYAQYGPGIGRFYTILTIIALLIPLFTSIYCFVKKSPALRYSVFSTLLAIAFVAFFYIYFKDANQQFYDAAHSAEQLKVALVTWGNWHWSRIVLELLSLLFLILSLDILLGEKGQSL